MTEKYRDLTKASFSMSDLLHQEALCLCDCSPVKCEPKTPSGSKSRLTQMSKYGEGPAHCIVRQWPSNNTPAQWGQRNPILLSDCILPQIWESLGDEFIAVKRDIVYSRLLDSDMRPKDNGDEEAFRLLIGKLLTRITAAALLFFLNAWSGHKEHSDHQDVLQSLRTFDIKHETKCESSSIPIRNDVNSHIPRNPPLPILKDLDGNSPTVPLFFANAKSTAHAEHPHSNPVTLIPDIPAQTVDQVLSHLLSIAERQKSSVADLDAFISQKTSAVWPHIATSHFSQVSQCFVVCTHVLIFQRWLTSWMCLPALLVHFPPCGGSTETVS